MYSKFQDTPTTKPVISSSLSAKQHVEEWIARHSQIQEILDGDGLAWNVDIQVKESPHEQNPRKTNIEVQVSLWADVDVNALLKDGTFDSQEDARLIALIGLRRIPLRMRPLRRHAEKSEEARVILAEILQSLKKSLADSELSKIKRDLIGRWVDQERRFGIP